MPSYLSLGEEVNRIKGRYTVCKINDSVFICTASDARDGRVPFVCEASAVERNILVQLLAFAPLGLILLQPLDSSLNLQQRNTCYNER